MDTLVSAMNMMDLAIPFARILNIEDIPARIIITLLTNILISALFTNLIQKTSINAQHYFNGLIGVIAMYYCFGTQIWHVVIDAILFTALIKTLGGQLSTVIITWITVLPHLLYGYYHIVMSGIEARTIYWTMPHCVLTLKLLGLSIDLFSTRQVKSKQNSLEKAPLETENISILEVFGFVFFYPTSLVGPQVQFRRYKDFVDGKLYERDRIKRNIPYGINRFIAGIVAGLFFSILVPYVPINHLVSKEFASSTLLYKLSYTALRHFIALKQYYTVWLFCEAACVFTGVSYKSEDKEGSVDWSSCAGVKLIPLETAYNTQMVVESFNVTTNEWAMQYVYKRFKFLNNKLLSQLITLLFISLWHGFYVGYYLCSFWQIPILLLEKIVTPLLLLSKQPKHARYIAYALGVIYRYHTVSIPFTFFQLLTWERCWAFSSAIQHCLFIEYAIAIPIFIVLTSMRRKPKKRAENSTD
ncbi:Lysophospholipid acyltransferase 5 [Oopsacas minuta]|uniref:Lysophospholipid acyltransferase 5 n=1 Tax=Oopsacas minuta TaxID=111878 RepID=A0AAV7JU99_9METZ|nr:Lysophospholipid acyltransferase 5 [Oopsacas minuta]